MLANNVPKSTILFTLQLLALLVVVECGSKVTSFEPRHNKTIYSPVRSTSLLLSSSPWLKKMGGTGPDDPPQGRPGCWKRPWICNQVGEWPPKKLCCKNVCVDVTSDPNNCGMCGIRCPFSWQCCRKLCSNTNISPLNCGKCGNICPLGVPCFYGMCGYAQPFPPWPFPPLPPRPPFPPFPPRPPFPPFPPRPPFPPKPPKPPLPPWPPRPPMPPLPPHPPKGDQ